SAVRSIGETSRIIAEAAERAGAPKNVISCLRLPTMEGTQELMKHPLTSLILATGGTGLVKAAYSAGKPAFGVGPGNVPSYIEKAAVKIAEMAGFTVPSNTLALVAYADAVRPDYPIAMEKLSPTLAFYVVKDWREGCAKCIEILNFGGLGHTLSVHTKDEEVVRQFGLRKPAFRICVNTPAALGAVGYTTNLFPSMTLGCGAAGGNITSDNI